MSDVVTLGDIRGRMSHIDIDCTLCPRRGRLSVARLIAQHGANAGLPTLLPIIAADCPRVAKPSASLYELCGARYLGLAQR